MLRVALAYLGALSRAAPLRNATTLPRMFPANATKCDADIVRRFDDSAKWAVIAINKQLPRIIEAYHLDPLVNVVHDMKVTLPHKFGCAELCFAEGFAKCEDYWLQVGTVDLIGLRHTSLLPLTLSHCEELDPSEDCHCRSTGPRYQGFRGSFTATAELNLEAKVDLNIHNGGLRAECKSIFGHWTNKLWSGLATCALKRAQVHITVEPCGALCTRSRGALTCLSALDVVITGNDFSCDFDRSSGIHHLADIIRFFLPHLERNLIAALGPVIKKALNNGVIDQILTKLHLPRVCKSDEVGIIV
eukprot:GEMP01031182.1.p1 GENE.GEMP01031182.1~~GEMP01031182.1.p1  ORF type:complete len:303 (+),score=55.14 GEMP01031182.1:232-1140(+)